MRIEKTFLLNEISEKVKDSTFLYLVDFNRVTVEEIAELRKNLSQEGDKMCYTEKQPYISPVHQRLHFHKKGR